MEVARLRNKLNELLLFPQAEHDDPFDGLQTMMEGVIQFASYKGGGSFSSQMRDRDYFDDFDL